MAEHTHGPWLVVGARPEGLIITSQGSVEALGKIVAVVPGPHRNLIDPETEAAGRLITAAPELLAIVQEIGYWEDDGIAQGFWTPAYRAYRQRVHDAILKDNSIQNE